MFTALRNKYVSSTTFINLAMELKILIILFPSKLDLCPSPVQLKQVFHSIAMSSLYFVSIKYFLLFINCFISFIY